MTRRRKQGREVTLTDDSTPPMKVRLQMYTDGQLVVAFDDGEQVVAIDVDPTFLVAKIREAQGLPLAEEKRPW